MTYSKESSSLVFKTSKTKNKLKLDVKISLNDECKNGHQDFSITATGYEKAGNYFVDSFSGCCHKEILDFFPEFKIFVDLHLCDYSGSPIHCISNMFYHMRHTTKEKFQEYYNSITDEFYYCLNKADDQLYFKYILYKLEIPKIWKITADRAIEKLEELTNTKFFNDSKRSNLSSLTEDEIVIIERRLKENYYTSDNIKKRKIEIKENNYKKKIEKLIQTYENELNTIHIKFYINKLALDLFDRHFNIIYYLHTNEIVFNWYAHSDFFTKEEFNLFKEKALENDYLKNCNFKFMVL